MHNSEINIKNISKVEGHASLNIKIKNNKVKKVNLIFTDAKRFFEQAMKGQSIETQPQSVSRICGTCSIAHIMGCITAIEKDGADTIVLGCGGILGVEERILKELKVPVVVPGVAALKICEDLICMGIAQSKHYFGTPPEVKRIL